MRLAARIRAAFARPTDRLVKTAEDDRLDAAV